MHAEPGRPTVADPEWSIPVGEALGGTVRVLARRQLAGGYVAASVERIDLRIDGTPTGAGSGEPVVLEPGEQDPPGRGEPDAPGRRGRGRRVSVVLKMVSAVEAAAMRALAEMPDPPHPRPLVVGDGWLVVPYLEAAPLVAGAPVPDEVWDTLARVHAHWWGRRPPGVPVVDPDWWAGLCERTLVAVRGGLARTGAAEFARAERALCAWRADPVVATALTALPGTLVHGDAHRGNVLGEAMIDWGAARVAPAALDLATLRAQGAPTPERYRRTLDQHGVRPDPALADLERNWADLHAHVHYLGFAADHLGAARVGEMIDIATAAHARLPR